MNETHLQANYPFLETSCRMLRVFSKSDPFWNPFYSVCKPLNCSCFLTNKAINPKSAFMNKITCCGWEESNAFQFAIKCWVSVTPYGHWWVLVGVALCLVCGSNENGHLAELACIWYAGVNLRTRTAKWPVVGTHTHRTHTDLFHVFPVSE